MKYTVKIYDGMTGELIHDLLAASSKHASRLAKVFNAYGAHKVVIQKVG